MRDKVMKVAAMHAIHSTSVTTLTESIEALTATKTSIDQAQEFVQKTALATQSRIKYKLESVVNTALSAVFGDIYQFALIFEIKRNKTEARIVLLEKGYEIDPQEDGCGGVNDILAMALRMALLIVSTNRRILILDEVMKFVSEDLREAAYSILQTLSTELHVDIIAVTHDKYMAEFANKEIRVSKDESGISFIS